jgi:uncharacterized GH25 family protein
VVLASAPVAGESLSVLRCDDDGYNRPLLDCQWGSQREQLLTLVAQRQGETPVLARAVTAKDGTFSLEGLEAGPYSLWVESAEGTGLQHDVAAGDEGLELMLGAGVRLSGTVTDDGMTPVPGALVTAIFKAHSRFFEAVTDDRGHFRLGPIPPGDYMMLITREGLASWSGDFTGYMSEVEKRFTLQRPKRLSGRVLRGGVPVSGAEVLCQRLVDFPVPALVTTTDAAGRFSFEGLDPEVHELIATHGGEGAMKWVYFEERQREHTDITLELVPAAYVRGRVLNDERQPIQGARVAVEWERKDMKEGEVEGVSEGSRTSALTDEEGRYRLGPLVPGLVSMSVNAKGYAMIRRQQESLVEERTVDFNLARVALIEGVLVDASGQPVTDEPLSLRSLEPGDYPHLVPATSDAEGRFSLGAPRPGRYKLQAGGRKVKEQEVEVLAPSSPRLVADYLPSVEVEVVDEAGMPLPDVSLGLWPATAAEDVKARVGWGYTNLRGRSVVTAPTPGRYRLAAELARDDFIRLASEWVELGETPARVRLRFEAGQELSGSVVDSRGQPIPEALIRLESPLDVQVEGCGSPPRGTSTGSDGRFVFRQLSGERFVLKVFKGHYELSPSHGGKGHLQVTPGMKDLRLVLDRKVFIQGQLLRADGSPIPRFQVNGVRVEDEEGSFAMMLPGEETLRLQLSAPGFKPVWRTVAAWDVEEVDLGRITLVPEG